MRPVLHRLLARVALLLLLLLPPFQLQPPLLHLPLHPVARVMEDKYLKPCRNRRCHAGRLPNAVEPSRMLIW